MKRILRAFAVIHFSYLFFFIPVLACQFLNAAVWNIPADFATPQAAIDAVNTEPSPDEYFVKPGDTLVVSPGTYPVFFIPDRLPGLVVRSSGGRDATVIDGTGSAIWQYFGTAAADSTIDGFTLKKKDDALVNGDAIQLKNLFIDSVGARGIRIRWGKGISITDTIIMGSAVTGLWVNHESSSKPIEELTLRNVNIDGPATGIFLAGVSDTRDILMENCTISGCSKAGISIQMNGLCFHRRLIIRNCLFTLNPGKGITAFFQSATYPDTDHVRIYNNYFADNGLNADMLHPITCILWNTDKSPGPNIIGGPFLGGNYWDNYTGSDIDMDGLGDTYIPHPVQEYPWDPVTLGDYRPLVGPLPDVSIAPEDISVPLPVRVPVVESRTGDTVELTATLRNYGQNDANEVQADLFVNGFLIGTKTVSVPAGGSRQVSFTWNPWNWPVSRLKDLEAKNQKDIMDSVWADVPVDIYVSLDPYFRIPDQNPENNTASKRIEIQVIPDLELMEVVPVQAIVNVPMILNKPMMTRVFIKLTELSAGIFSAVHGVKTEVTFDDGNPPQTLPAGAEMSLVNCQGKGYIVPKEKVSMFRNLLKNEDRLKQCLFKNGWDAFNMENDGLNPRPRRQGYSFISAYLLNRDADIVANNGKTVSILVKESNMDLYKILYLPLDSLLTEHTKTVDWHRQIAKEHTAFIQAVYPVPDADGYYGHSRRTANGKPYDPATIHGFWMGETSRMARKGSLYAWHYNIDSVVWIIPQCALGIGTAGQAHPQAGMGVFVDETQGFPLHLSAHEIGHTWGLAGGRGRTEEYDKDKDIRALYTGADGWDVRGIVSGMMKRERPRYNYKPEDVLDGLNYHTFMGDYRVQQPWVTEANYRRLMDGMWPWGGLVSGGSDPRVLFVSGEIKDDGTAELWPFYAGDGILVTPEPGSCSVDCESLEGTLLSSTPFEPVFDIHTGGTSAFFGFPVLYPDGTARVVLRQNSVSIAQRDVSVNAPCLEIISVQDMGDDMYRVSWTAEDEDGDTLEYIFSFSKDGAAWSPLEGEFQENKGDCSLTFDTLPLSGGSSCLVKITVTDGVNTAEEITSPFFVRKKGPEPYISSPEDGSEYFDKDEIFFRGLGYDAEDKNVDISTYVWTSDRDGEIASGVDFFSVSNLSRGEHEITLEMQDSDGNISGCSVGITVKEGFSDTDGDDIPDWWEEENFDGLDEDDESDPDEDGYPNLEEYEGFSDPNEQKSFPVDKGDVSGDKDINISDVILCLRMAIGLPVTVGDEIYELDYPWWITWRADFNGDGKTDISDVILILRKSIGLTP